MKSAAMFLTVLLALLLTANVPATVETCCAPTPSCCASTKCQCHMSSPAKPAPVAATPVMPHLEFCPPSRTEVAGRPTTAILHVTRNDAAPLPRSLFILTHAFLI